MRQRKFPGPGVPGSRASERRRRGAGWCVLGLACGLAVAACTGPSSRSASGAPEAASLSSQLRQKIEAAQDPVGYLVKTTAAQQESGSSGSSTATIVWTDLATGNAMMQRGSGSARMASWEHDYYEDRVLHWDQTQVNYGPRTWWTAHDHANAPVSGPVPKEATEGGYTPAPLMDDVLGRATAKVAGYPVLGGIHTIELSASESGSRFDFWVDGSTYRVLRSVKYFPATMPVPPVTFDYDWVQASAAMVNLINDPQVPAGFTQVQLNQSVP